METDNTEEEELDEEEEEEHNEEEQDDEGEEEEVDILKRDRKKHLGDTSIYDPVALADKNVLLPGKPDLILSYNGQTYRFATEDDRNAFLQSPLKYLPITRSPTVLLNKNEKKIEFCIFIFSCQPCVLFFLELKVRAKVFMDEN